MKTVGAVDARTGAMQYHGDVLKYNEDQERDDHGRFGSGGSAEDHDKLAGEHDKEADRANKLKSEKTTSSRDQRTLMAAKNLHENAADAHRDAATAARSNADDKGAKSDAANNATRVAVSVSKQSTQGIRE